MDYKMSLPLHKREYVVWVRKPWDREQMIRLLLPSIKRILLQVHEVHMLCGRRSGYREWPKGQQAQEETKHTKYFNFQLRENYAIIMQIMLCDAEKNRERAFTRV